MKSEEFKANTNLGLYDMVMAMSEDSINFLLKVLKDSDIKNKCIKDTWSVRLILEGPYDEIKDIIMDETKEEYEKAFKEAATKVKMQGFYSEIGYPTIKTIDDKSSLIFRIPFEKDGTLDYSWRSYPGESDPNASYPLEGLIYAFRVDLKKMSIPYKDKDKDKNSMITEIANHNITDEVEKLILSYEEKNNSTIKAEDFTIEQLFLDFESTDISSYDEKETVFPPDMGEKESTYLKTFQKCLSNYLKGSLAKENNPYILGYGLDLPTLEKRDKAVFEPLSLDFSTSYNKNQSSLNYLMTLDEMSDERKENNSLGVLNSLVSTNSNSEIDGTLAIDFDIFYDRYLDKVTNRILEQLNKVVDEFDVQEGDSSRYYNYSYSVKTEGKFVLQRSNKEVIFSSRDIKVEASEGSSGIGGLFATSAQKDIKVTPILDIDILKDENEEVNKLVLDLQLPTTIEYKYKGSAFLTTHEGKESSYSSDAGKPDGLKITIYPVQNRGDFQFDIEIVEGLYNCITNEDKDTIEKANEIIEHSDIYKPLKSKSFLETLKSSLSTEIKSLPKVILPIGNVFSYKSIDFPYENVITFDSAYMPTIIKEEK